MQINIIRQVLLLSGQYLCLYYKNILKYTKNILIAFHVAFILNNLHAFFQFMVIPSGNSDIQIIVRRTECTV